MKKKLETTENDFSDFRENHQKLAEYISYMVQSLEKKGERNNCSTLSTIEEDSFIVRLNSLEQNDKKIGDPIEYFIKAVAEEHLYFDPRINWYHMLTDPTVVGKIGYILGVLINENLVSAEVSKIGTEIHKRLSSMILDIVGMNNVPGSIALSTTGGSESNAIAMKLALYEVTKNYFKRYKLSIDLQKVGLQGCNKNIKILVPDTAHYSFNSITQTLGLGLDNLVKIKSTDFRVSANDVKNALDSLGPNDLAIGIVSIFGTTETGSYDDIPEIAKVIEEYKKDHDIWWHIDAAYGGPFLLLDEFKNYREAISSADSVTIDPHKHLWTPFGVAFLCVKKAIAFRTISTDAIYIGNHTKHITDEEYLQGFFNHVGGVTFSGSRLSSGVISTYLTLVTMGKDKIKKALMKTMETTKLLENKLKNVVESGVPVIVTSNQMLNLLTFKPNTGSISKDNDLVIKVMSELAKHSENGALVSKTNLNNGKDAQEILVNRICIMSPIATSDDVEIFVNTYRKVLNKVLNT